MINELRENIRSKVNGDYDFRTRINMISIDGTMPSKTKSTTSKDTKSIAASKQQQHHLALLVNHIFRVV
jgi:hypothetical protein